MVIDPATAKGAKVAARLRDELVAWLVTVAADGTPVPTPVWVPLGRYDDPRLLAARQAEAAAHPSGFARAYSVAIRIRPTRLRAW